MTEDDSEQPEVDLSTYSPRAHTWRSEGDRPGPGEVFPFGSYREHQREALHEASTALWEEGYDTVIMNLPTGVGKSPINTALARQASSAFMTTPQKKLRQQLEDDEVLTQYYETIRARADYLCPVESEGEDLYDCKTCPVNFDEDRRCGEQRTPECTYWTAKERAMAAPIATLTFAALIIDGNLSVMASIRDPATEEFKPKQVTFDDRELLIVDEAHSLTDQVASMWAGFTVGPGLPGSIYEESVPLSLLIEAVGEDGPDIWRFEQLDEMFHSLVRNAREHIKRVEMDLPTPDEINTEPDAARKGKLEQDRQKGLKEIQRCESMISSIQLAWGDIDSGRPWVVNVKQNYERGRVRPTIEVKPVDVDRILQKLLWHRTDKRVLSSATVPYPHDPDRWARELGLNPDGVKYIEYPMPFPPQNRPIVLDTAIDRMSKGGFNRNLERIADEIRELAEHHTGKKGLVHTVSYDRAEALYERLSDIAVLHDRKERRRKTGKDDQAFLDKWYVSDKPVFLSPACMEGVDLVDDKCRWQVLAKVPYPNLGDSRVRFIANEREEWSWYNCQTNMKIMQSVGRGVRHPKDSCTYYVLDKCIHDVIRRPEVPTWFTAAIQ